MTQDDSDQFFPNLTLVTQVRLYRPWSAAHFLAALPASTRRIAVVEVSSSPAQGNALYLDVLASLHSARCVGRLACGDACNESDACQSIWLCALSKVT